MFFVVVLPGFSGACSTALSSLGGVIREERNSLFRQRRTSQVAAKAAWSHKFVCLSSTTAERVPTTQTDKLALEEAGLGEKGVTIPDIDCSPESFNKLLLATYPKLESGGGFEFLRCKSQTRDLLLIGPRVSSNPRLPQAQSGQWESLCAAHPEGP